MEKLLISENRENAEIKVNGLYNMAKRLNAIITAFNNIKALERINTITDIEELAKQPKKWFDEKIINECGGGLTSKVKPNVQQLGAFYSIPYDELLKQLELLSRLPFPQYPFDGSKFFVSEEMEQQAYEEAKEYAETPEAIKAFNLTRNLCRVLDGYCAKMGVSKSNYYEIAKNLGLRHDGTNFNEYPSFVKNQLKYKDVQNALK